MDLKCPHCKYRGEIDQRPTKGTAIECESCGYTWRYKKWRRCDKVAFGAVAAGFSFLVILPAGSLVYDYVKHIVILPEQPVKAAPLLHTMEKEYDVTPVDRGDEYAFNIRWTDIKTDFLVTVDGSQKHQPVERVSFLMTMSEEDWNKTPLAESKGRFGAMSFVFVHNIMPILNKCFEGGKQFAGDVVVEHSFPEGQNYKDSLTLDKIYGPYKFKYHHAVHDTDKLMMSTKAMMRVTVNLL